MLLNILFVMRVAHGVVGVLAYSQQLAFTSSGKV